MKFLLKRPIVFFDLETTGANPETSRIVQLAAVKLFPDRTVKEWTWLVNPLMPIPSAASDIHGITDEDVLSAPTFKEVSREVLSVFEDSDLSGFNIMNFDVPLLLHEFDRVGISIDEFQPFSRRYFDVRNIYNRLFERTLSAIYKQYFDKELEGAHDALNDVRATLELFGALLEKHEEVPKTAEELDLFSSFDKPRVDVSGYFYSDGDGQYRFARGKHRDELARDHFSYIVWMIDRGNFPPDTVYIASKVRRAILLKKGIDEV